jgi:hypothetical protein
VSTDTLWHLAQKLDEEIKIISDDLALGGAKDFGDYKFHCGRLRGLFTAKGVIMDYADQLEKKDD